MPAPLQLRGRLGVESWTLVVLAALALVLFAGDVVLEGIPGWTRLVVLVIAVLLFGGTLLAALDVARGELEVARDGSAWLITRRSPLRRSPRALRLERDAIAQVDIVSLGRPTSIPGGRGGRAVRVSFPALPVHRDPVDLAVGLNLPATDLQALRDLLRGPA